MCDHWSLGANLPVECQFHPGEVFAIAHLISFVLVMASSYSPSLLRIMRSALVEAVGLIHAAIATPSVALSVGLSATTTRSSAPSKNAAVSRTPYWFSTGPAV